MELLIHILSAALNLNGKSLEISIEYCIEISIEILRSSMEKMKLGTHKLCKKSIYVKPESTDLTHEDTITIKDLDDGYAGATDSLIIELDVATAE